MPFPEQLPGFNLTLFFYPILRERVDYLNSVVEFFPRIIKIFMRQV